MEISHANASDDMEEMRMFMEEIEKTMYALMGDLSLNFALSLKDNCQKLKK